MTEPSTSPSKFRIFLKWGGLCLLIVAAIWITVIIWWQSTSRAVTAGDVMLYLVAIPATLLICIGAFQFMRHASKKRAENSTARAGLSNGDATNKTDPTAAEKALLLPIVSAWAVTSLADNAEEFVGALIEKLSRPHPDGLLLDDQGFPLASSRVPDLDISATQERLLQIVSKNSLPNLMSVPDMGEWRDTFLRALTLLDNVIDQAHNDWSSELTSVGAESTSQATSTLRGAAPVHTRTEKPLNVQVKLILSAGFNPYEKQLSLAYLFEKLAAFPIPKEQLHIEIISANDDATALAIMDKFSLQTYRTNEAEALLVLACESNLCTTVAENWQAAGRLFGKQSPNGLMLGEAAFGVLCVSAKARKTAAMEPQCHLTRVVQAKREISADLPGKPSYVCLTAAVSEALQFAGVNGETIGSVACDADHRTSRILECIGTMTSHTPQLDAIENRIAVNEACGHIGAASVLGAVVAGVIQAKNESHPVLLFTVSHMDDRAAAVLLPISDMPEAA